MISTRYVAFKYEMFTDINKEIVTPLFDIKLDKVGDACKLFRSHISETMLNTKFDMNVCLENLADKGFDDEAGHTRIYEKYQVITYVLIEYDFEFQSEYTQLFSGPHYEFWMREADKMSRELKIKTILDD